MAKARRLLVVALVVALAVGCAAGAAAGARQGGGQPAEAPAAKSAAEKIKHLVVLMMENRSFQHMMGLLKEKNPAINACLPNDSDPRCWNPQDPQDPNSKKFPVGDRAVYIQPADPSHSVPSTTQQLFGSGTASGTPLNDGFIVNYAKHSPINATGNGTEIMECFSPSSVPVIDALAENFMTFDHWFAGVPGPTMVNRAFAQSATSDGMGHNDIIRIALGLPQKTIFEQLDEGNVDWNVFFSDFPTSIQFNYTRHGAALDNFKPLEVFYKTVKAGKLPSFSWVEPRYLDLAPTWPASDQHPDHDVAEGEKLIKNVYEALRAADTWNETMFVVTYDEHGGFFDSVPPGPCPSPDGKVSTDPPFDFKRLGIRIPTIVASPYTPAGSVTHEPASGTGHYEHSSIPKTIRNLFAPSLPALTARDAWAEAFDEVSTPLDSPRDDTPKTLPDAPSHRAFGSLPEANGQLPCTELQRVLAHTAAGLVGEEITEEELDGQTERDCGMAMIERLNRFFGQDIVRLPEDVKNFKA